jgi:hypothetical protein
MGGRRHESSAVLTRIDPGHEIVVQEDQRRREADRDSRSRRTATRRGPHISSDARSGLKLTQNGPDSAGFATSSRYDHRGAGQRIAALSLIPARKNHLTGRLAPIFARISPGSGHAAERLEAWSYAERPAPSRSQAVAEWKNTRIHYDLGALRPCAHDREVAYSAQRTAIGQPEGVGSLARNHGLATV